MKTLDVDISNLIKQSKNLNHRVVILLTGENRLKRLGVACNFIEKLGTKNILYCYVKDNKKRKLAAKENIKHKSNDNKKGNNHKNVKNGKRISTCQLVQNHLQKHCPSEIRWCLYKETQNILGKTFDICIFQDYEFLTPNIIARGMETVSGGGLVIFLAPSLSELESNFDLSHNSSINSLSNAQRFLKRFTVSLLSSKFCVCIDDQFNFLNKKKKPIKINEKAAIKNNHDLICLKESLKIADSLFYPMVNMCATYDQAKCLHALCSSIRMFHHPSNKDYNDVRCGVISLITAARGRGKSAALGLALCAALETGMSQICVTSPSPENISTLWQYVKLGLKAMNYTEHIDFSITTSYLNDAIKTITKVELKKSKFSQVIRYIAPSETESLDCDLLCIDEAAAIPLNILQMYLRSFNGLVFVSSTISGYEGSGMMLSTNLFKELRDNYSLVNTNNEMVPLIGKKGRLYEIALEEPIRYGNNDPVELYLYKTLCMNYKQDANKIHDENITPDQCHLAVLNRDALFDCSKSSEKILQHIMSIYSASNHQNSPDDLKSLADDECSRILCLTNSPFDSKDPNIIVIIHINYEGDSNKEFVNESIRNTGVRPVVDVLSNILMEEYLEPNFKQLSGMRIEMIATDPNYLNRGFGSQALKLLLDYTETPISYDSMDQDSGNNSVFMPISTLPKISLNYIGVYTGLSAKLIKFFQRIGDFMVVYVESEINEITGDCKGILVKRIPKKITPDYVYNFNWLALFTRIFSKRFELIRHGQLKYLDEDLKALISNSSYQEIKKEYDGLPEENIRSFCI